MTTSLIAMVLLGEPIRFDEVDVCEVVASFPVNAKAKLKAIENEGTSLQVSFDDMNFTVVATPEPMALGEFARQFAQPSSKAIEPMIATHRAKLSITCADVGVGFGEAVMSATIVHLLATKLGALGKPLGGYWVPSERLCDWAEFTAYGDAVMPAFENDPETKFPTRYWVSVQLKRNGSRFGGETLGLRPFMGFELDLEPIAWPMPHVAERVVGTVTYLFMHGSVLNDGETLGITQQERFRLRHDKRQAKMKLILEATV